MHALLGWLALSIGPASTPASEIPAVLKPGVPIERQVTAGGSHEYAIALKRGDLLHAVVEQRGIDTVEEMFDPSGRRVLRVDTARGAFGPEPLWIVVHRTGTYRLRITPLFRSGRGAYAIRVEDCRPSTARDRRRAEAARIHAASRNFEEQTTPRARDESLKGLVRAAALWAETGDAREQALALLDVGRALQYRARTRESLEPLRRAESLAAVASEPQLQARILGSLGLAFSFLGDPAAAYETFAKSVSLARAGHDPQQEANGLHGQAFSRWHSGNFQEALELDRKSLAIARSLADRELEAWSLWGLGLTDVMIGELDRSVEESGEALARWRELGDSYGESFTLQNLGYAYWLMGRGPQALETYRQALAVARTLGNGDGQALALTNIGLAETDLVSPAAAAQSLAEAVRLWRASGNKHGETLALRNLGQALERLGRRPEALASSEESVNVARAGGDRPSEAYALDGLAQLEAREGNLDAARRDIEDSLAILESLRGRLATAPLQSSFFSTKQDYYGTAVEIFLRLHERHPHEGHEAQAFGVLERGRARALTDAIAEARLELSNEPTSDLSRRERDLGGTLDRLQKELATASDRAAAESRLRRAEEEWEVFLAEMRRKAPRDAAFRYPAAISYEETRSLVDSASALVSYALQTDRPVVFVLTSAGLVVRRLPVPAEDLRERVENYVALLARDDRNRWTGLSNELYRELISPWREDLPAGVRRLVVVPDGVLHSLPFETLARPGPRPRLLIEDFAVSYVPSATVLAELSRSRVGIRTTGPTDVLVVAAPAVDGLASRSGEELEGETFDLSPLPDAAAEARAIGRFGGPASEIDVGPNALESRIKGRSLDRFGVLHFATHALLSRKVPSRSALLLVSDGGSPGLLTAREIHRLKLHSDLVVLSACQTAQGRILAGEGVQSLARAFFHAGAHSLVASLWDVEDRPTAPLMTSFYRQLAVGSSKAEALREAKLDMLRENPDLAPRYWAPFVLIGEPNGRIPLHDPVRRWPVAIAAAVLGGVSWMGIRRQRRARPKEKDPSFATTAVASTSTVQE